MKLRPLICVLLAACGPTSFKSFCEQRAEAQCRQAQRCQPDAFTATWASLDACSSDVAAQAHCDLSPVCGVNGLATRRCLADIAAADCVNTSFSAVPLPDSCATIACASTSTTLTCARKVSITSSTTCEVQEVACTDGNTYAISCDVGVCACLQNGSGHQSFNDTGFCGLSSADQRTFFASECNFPR